MLHSDTSRQEPRLWKAKNWHKDGELKKKKKKVKFGDFSYFISSS